MSFQPVAPAQSRSQQIMSQIESQIRSGALQVGEKLATEKELSEQFGVSRSVVREAIKLLEAMGLVVSRQGSGSYVRNDTGTAVSRLLSLSVSPNDRGVQDLFEFREGLELLSARWAADRRNDQDLEDIRGRLEQNRQAAHGRDAEGFTVSDWQFHSRIAEATGNQYLTVVLSAVREMQHDVVAMMSSDIGSMERAIGEHERIVDALERGDAAEAEEAARAHIASTRKNIEEMLHLAR